MHAGFQRVYLLSFALHLAYCSCEPQNMFCILTVDNATRPTPCEWWGRMGGDTVGLGFRLIHVHIGA